MYFQWENLSDPVFHHAKLRPDSPAIYERDAKLTYRELADLVGKATVYLHDLGIKRGELIGLSLSANAEHLILLLAAIRIGAVPVDIPMRRPSHVDPFQRFGIGRVLATPGAPPSPKAAVHTIEPGWRRSLAGISGD